MIENRCSDLDVIDAQRLMSLIPHRYPFLLIDRVVAVDSDRSAIGIKNVSINEPFFVGHFPNEPVLPGVLLIEAMAQTACAICSLKIKTEAGDGQPVGVYFMTVDKVKFRKPVTPGDVLELHVQKIRQRARMYWFKGAAKVGGILAAEGEIGAVLTK